MRDPATRRGRRSWAALNAVLGLVVLALVTACLVLVARGAQALPGRTTAERRSDEYVAVTAAAKREALAFLEVDYRRMGPLIAAVLRGATGAFKAEYAGSKDNLIVIAKQSRVRSTGTVRSVGIDDIDSDSATVLVAADSSVTNKDSAGRRKARYYRLRLTLVRTDGAWLTSRLEFVS